MLQDLINEIVAANSDLQTAKRWKGAADAKVLAAKQEVRRAEQNLKDAKRELVTTLNKLTVEVSKHKFPNLTEAHRIFRTEDL